MITFELKNLNDTKLLIALQGFTIRGFSKEIGVSHSFLSHILNGKRKPSPVVAKKIADGLNKKVEDIFLVRVVDELPIEVVKE